MQAPRTTETHWQVKTMGLRKINALIGDEYINNNDPISTLTDAAQHLVRKNIRAVFKCIRKKDWN